MKLCDAHIHYIPEELSVHTTFYKGAWTDKQKLFEHLDTHNIEKALLVYPSTDAHLKLGSMAAACDLYNKALEGILKEDSRIIASGIIDIEDLSTVDQAAAQFKEKGFGAISIASSHNGQFLVEQLKPLFKASAEYGLPLFVHPQTANPIGFERVKDPLLMPVIEYSTDISMFLGLLMMEGILEQYKVTFIFSALAGVIPFLKERFDRVYMMLRSRGMVKDLGGMPSDILKGVYADTSGSSLAHVQLAIDLFGEDHIVWGSDYPVNVDIQSNLAEFDPLGQRLKQKITHSNLGNLFNP